MPTPNTHVQTVGDWQWQVWELNPKTGRPFKWIGQFFDHKDAFTWVDKQPRGRNGYTVNNVPPTVKSSKPLGSTSVTATSPTRVVNRENVEDFPVRVRQVRPAMSDAEKQARYDRIKAGEVEATKPSARKPARKAAPVTQPKAKPKKQDSREMKRIKEDAQKIIDQHKADEQADIEAGNTEAV